MNSNIYIPQSQHIKNAIHSVWQTAGLTTFHNEQIIPKGIVEVIFNFSHSTPILAQVGDKQFRLSNCFINGFNRVPLQLQLPERLMFLGIRLQPLAVKKILGAPAGEFSDTIVDMDLLDSTFHSLWHRLADQIHFDNRISVLSAWMEKKLPDFHLQEKMINHFLSGIDQHDVSVTEIARSLFYSPRQLSRKMAEATGMNTEEILLYKKYLHAMDLIHHTDLSLTQIAYQSHFSDQSHFIKSFKAYTGMTPGAYKTSKSFMKGHIYENVR
ncbi:MAG TPA: helix-turn-helix transcriptional regulator [Puia sp.]|nr:helix-turn-helix transcriptional regulator [Puia sp.]